MGELAQKLLVSRLPWAESRSRDHFGASSRDD